MGYIQWLASLIALIVALSPPSYIPSCVWLTVHIASTSIVAASALVCLPDAAVLGRQALLLAVPHCHLGLLRFAKTRRGE